ncbi:MAG: hypothetical protein GY856_24550, partial [bacterium]|nr:hypothetical protein [bacterium]
MQVRDIRSEWILSLALLLAASPLAAAPRFLDLTPPPGEVLTEEVVLQGDVEDAVHVTVAGETIQVTGTRFTAGPFPLTRCPAEFLLTATSSDGRTTSVVHRVDCDLKPPRILVELPVAPRVNASPVRVRGRAVDPHLSEVLVAGRPAELSGDRFEARVPLTEGEQTIEVVARDRFGHQSRRQLALTLDTTAPDVRITADGVPLAGGETFGGAVRPKVAAGDDEQLRIRLNGQPWQPGSTISDEGRYVLQVEAADAAGNRTRR